MKIVFAGTPDLATPCLQALLDSEHDVVAVYSQPDRPAGRGRQLQQSPVKQLALQHNLPVEQPLNFKDPADIETLRDYGADLMVVIAYGLLLPTAVLEAFPFGCINPHVSLLPKWRGAAPIQRAIEAGDTETGVTLIQMDQGWDTGDMLGKKSIAISPTDTSQIIHDKLADVAADLLIETLPRIFDGTVERITQNDALSSHAKKLSKAEAEIDWHSTATNVHNKVRAFNPWPVCYGHFNGEIMRVWQTEVVDETKQHATPGSIVGASKHGIDVACGTGVIRLLELQLPGNKRIRGGDFFNAKGKALISQSLAAC